MTDWNDQVKLFTEAAAFSPTSNIHYVVPNAGIAIEDDVFAFEPEAPKKPALAPITVNLVGVLYTIKLALHYFMKHNGTSPSPKQEDTCLILMGSGAAFCMIYEPSSKTVLIALQWTALEVPSTRLRNGPCVVSCTHCGGRHTTTAVE